MNRALLSAALPLILSVTVVAAEPSVDFDRDIRPILADRCFQCHGPDGAKREADLRLDTRAGIFSPRDDQAAVVAGDSAKSLLYQRILTSDEDERMPPTDAGEKLSATQADLIRRWIDSGAAWQQHWSLIAPVSPKIPQVKHSKSVRNPIDPFILARLEREGLAHSAAANKATLIRRVSLDLTGLPPTLQEVDAFLADSSPQAYEKVVDRLLKSPRFGERMAAVWLDAARYADTSGYQNDGPRDMWRWRDWVIEAFNQNKSYDQFTVEQIAGDMLPAATLDQQIASGFNRNHRGNAEGGIIPEEFQVEYVIDRVETTFTVFLGLTMGCVRCHEHKFDPFEQEEFYRVYAYFNNIPESGRAIKTGNSPPYIKAPTREQQNKLAQIEEKLKAAQQIVKKLEPSLAAAQKKWEKSSPSALPADWSLKQGLVAFYPLNGNASNQIRGEKKSEKKTSQNNKSKEKDNPPSEPPAKDTTTYAAGHLGLGAEFGGKEFIDAGDVGNFGFFDKFSLGTWIRPQGKKGGTIFSRMTDVNRGAGWQVRLQQGKVQVNLVKRWLDDAIRVQTKGAVTPDQWHHLMVTYDGSRVAAGLKIYIDGKPQKLDVQLDGLNQDFKNEEPLRIGGGGGEGGNFHGLIDDVRIYKKWLSSRQVAVIATADTIKDILTTAAKKRRQPQNNKLRAYYLARQAPANVKKAFDRQADLLQEKQRLVEILPTVMVMKEMNPPRETFILNRGEYDNPGKKVTPGVPASLPPLPQGVKNNRLGFARWLVDPSNPLTSRVAVNRFWQIIFGSGLVKTPEDFGTQGERPSHPQLLDWLATEFIRSGWDSKAMLKLMVTSSSYRQSSRVSAEMLEKDPENRLLGRGPRIRLTAEMIRDQALAASGLLKEKVGGPSVKPYQPKGLWKEIATVSDYQQSKGDDLYRRSLYTYWKRTVAAPSMMTFDAPAREACSVRRSRTNTPLQALTLMNEVTFVEAARVLAQRVMNEADAKPQDRLTLAFRLVTSRPPSEEEMKILLTGWQAHLEQYRSDPKSAEKLISSGDAPLDKSLNPIELAAYTTMASLILNLDEAVTNQ